MDDNEIQLKLSAVVDELTNKFNEAQASIDKLEESTDGLKEPAEQASFSFTELNSAIGVGKEVIQKLGQAYDETIGVFVEYANQVRELRDVTGMSAEETSRLIQLADDYKISTQQLEMAQKKLASQGKSLSTETLAQMSDEFLRLKDGQEKSKFLFDNLGKSGIAFADIMSKGSAAIREQAAAQNDARILNDKLLAQARLLEMQQNNLNDSVEAFKIRVGSGLVPVLSDLMTMQENYSKEQEKSNNIFEYFITYVKGGIFYVDKYKEAHEKNAEALKQLDEQQKATGKSTEELEAQQQALTDTYNTELGLMQELTTADEKATAKIVYNNILKKLSVDGLTESEFNQAQQLGVSLGIFTQASADEAVALNTVTTAAANGQISMDQLSTATRGGAAAIQALANQINTMPTHKTVTIDVNSVYRNMTGTYLPATQGFAEGGEFTVPQGYPNDSYKIGVQSGEHVSVTPAGQQPKAEKVDNTEMLAALRDINSLLRSLPEVFALSTRDLVQRSIQ